MIKPLGQFYDAEARTKDFVWVDPETGELRPMTLADHYQAVAAVRLSASVPEPVVSHFDAARQVLLYSWLAYETSGVAEQRVYSTIEFALKTRFDGVASAGPRRPGFKALLAEAVERGLLSDAGFANRRPGVRHAVSKAVEGLIVVEDGPAGEPYCEFLVETLPRLRNHLAHGANYVNTPWNVLDHVTLARDLINLLFERRAEA
jgi:hypothetical protein